MIFICVNDSEAGATENADFLTFESRIKEFVTSEKESVLSFPSSLSSYQRRFIHEV